MDGSNPVGNERNSEKVAFEQSGEKWRGDRIGRHYEELLCVKSHTKSKCNSSNNAKYFEQLIKLKIQFIQFMYITYIPENKVSHFNFTQKVVNILRTSMLDVWRENSKFL